jgi:hypothetical protein
MLDEHAACEQIASQTVGLTQAAACKERALTKHSLHLKMKAIESKQNQLKHP